MAKAPAKDQFVNQAVINCLESAANTLTFKKLETGISLFEKMAWLIQRVEYFFADMTATVFNSTGDKVTVAISTTDQLASLSISNAAVLDILAVQRRDFGAAAVADLYSEPYTKDFSMLSGGGLLVPPNPLYLGVVGSGMAAAMEAVVKIFYTNVELSIDQYWELVESRRIISS